MPDHQAPSPFGSHAADHTLSLLTLHENCGTMMCSSFSEFQASVKGNGMKAKRTRRLAMCALIAYSAILVRFVVFKAIPTIRIGHLRLRFGGSHTGPGNFVPFKTIVPQLIGPG